VVYSTDISGMGKNTLRLGSELPESLATAAELLLDGGLVAIPTETVYGLAANAFDATAIQAIFTAKQRPHWDPLIVHVSDEAMLQRVVSLVPATVRRLMDAFWPGPLTLLLPRRSELPLPVTAGRELVGVRMPSHPVALALLRAVDVPLAAPSANRFGHISPTTAQHVLADLDGRIDAVLDAGPCSIGVESTVLDPSRMVLYREGGVSREQIERVAQAAVSVYQPSTDDRLPDSLPSPGVGIRHYAPSARLVLVQSEVELHDRLFDLAPSSAGVLLPFGWSLPASLPTKVFVWERWDNPSALARTLYAGLRALDALGVSVIICPLPGSSEVPMVQAIRDRLMKAARAA
jgi:L-threonylcarbamoyladenylate synthase